MASSYLDRTGSAEVLVRSSGPRRLVDRYGLGLRPRRDPNPPMRMVGRRTTGPQSNAEGRWPPARSAVDRLARQIDVRRSRPEVTDEGDDIFFHRQAGLHHDLLIVRWLQKRPDSREPPGRAPSVMSRRSWRRAPPLTVIPDGQSFPPNGRHRPIESGGARAPVRDHDWSALMAQAQGGDGVAYRRLLEEIAPYLRSLAAKRHRE